MKYIHIYITVLFFLFLISFVYGQKSEIDFETNAENSSHDSDQQAIYLQGKNIIPVWKLNLKEGNRVTPGNKKRPNIVPGHELLLLPENARYFQYKGLPFVSFVRRGDWRMVPTTENIDASLFDDLVRNSNHLYLSVHDTWIRATWQQLYDKLNDDEHWLKLRQVVEWAYERDIMLSLIAWTFFWNYGEQKGGREVQFTDMVFPPDDTALTMEVVNGLSRLDLHRWMIRRLVEASWGFPNVTYNFQWEYGIMHVNRAAPTKDPDGAFHRWWVDEMKAEGKRQFPDVKMKHLFSILYGGKHPSFFNADFIVEEDGNSIRRDGATIEIVQSYGIPVVPWSLDDWRAVGVYGGQTNMRPEHIRDVIPYGLHVSSTWRDLSPAGQDYYLQARWYMENIKTWDDEVFSGGGPSGGDEINEVSLPYYVPSSRPELVSLMDYKNGVRVNGNKVSFAVLYKDADGDPPALAEVWVDINGDGRFASNPVDGERITMTRRGSDFKNGVLYTAGGIAPKISKGQSLRYVFRFADQHWYPPIISELVPGNYTHLIIDDFPSIGLSERYKSQH